MELAIVIPFYKKTFFEQTLQSLAAQTDKRFRVYIGNDASPEPIDDLLATYQQVLPISYKKFDNNLGGTDLVAQWERCLQLMHNDEKWVMILGDDDYLSPNAVATFYQHQAGIVQAASYVVRLKSVVVDEHNHVLSTKNEVPTLYSAIDAFFDKFQKEGRSSLSEHIFNVAQLRATGFRHYPLAWHSDDMAILEVAAWKHIYYLPQASCYVRISAQSLSGSTNNLAKKHQATALFFKDILQHIKHFNGAHFTKCIDLLRWVEKDKNINLLKGKRLSYYLKAYGIKGLKYYIHEQITN